MCHAYLSSGRKAVFGKTEEDAIQKAVQKEKEERFLSEEEFSKLDVQNLDESVIIEFLIKIIKESEKGYLHSYGYW